MLAKPLYEPIVGSRLRDFEQRLCTSVHSAVLAVPVPKLDAVIGTRRIVGYFDCLTDAYQDTQRQLTEQFGVEACDAFNRRVLIGLLREFDPRPYLPPQPPAWLYDSYVERVQLIAEQVIETPVGEYSMNSDALVKDLRILGGVSYPNYHLVVDRECYLPKTFYRYRGIRENLRAFLFIWLRAGGLGPYLRPHLDARFPELRRRNAPDLSRLRDADILESCPRILGTVESSWLNDPALEWVSPHLWVRYADARARRSFIRRDGYNEVDLEHAIPTSARRRRLYEEGLYRPSTYTSISLRKKYIAHVKARRNHESENAPKTAL